MGASDDAFTLSDYDLKSENVQKVGDFSNPNLESIIALEPDFVIMTSGSGAAEATRTRPTSRRRSQRRTSRWRAFR